MALARKNRLTKKKDIDAVFDRGKAVQGSFFFIKFKTNNMPESRMNFVVSTRVLPRAVDRNRVKRILSETARKYFRGRSDTGHDISVVIKKKGEEPVLIAELTKLLSSTLSYG